MVAITSTERPATAIRNLVCSRQSVNAADTVVVAMIEIGKSSSLRAEASRSRPSIGLVNRIVPWSAFARILHERTGANFEPIIASTCG